MAGALTATAGSAAAAGSCTASATSATVARIGVLFTTHLQMTGRHDVKRTRAASSRSFTVPGLTLTQQLKENVPSGGRGPVPRPTPPHSAGCAASLAPL